MWRTQRLFEREWDKALGRVGMTRAEVALLSLMAQAPGLSGSELARRTHLSIPGVAASLVRMEERGWVSRKPHRAHRRLLEVFLAARGKRKLQVAQRALRAVDARATRALGIGTRASLQAALLRMSRALEPDTDAR
jgi:DNA-binding MarR family transcriptional regulator